MRARRSNLRINQHKANSIEGHPYRSTEGFHRNGRYSAPYGDGLIDIIKNTADLIFHGVRTQPPPAFRETLNKYGDFTITKITINRAPIESGIATAVNVLSLGKVNKRASELAYDKLYHLSAVLHVQEGTQGTNKVSNLLLEKNAVPVLALTSNTSTYESKTIVVNVKLNDFINNTVNQMGPIDYITYDASRLNCQNFIMNHLSANGLLTPELENFIMQDAMAILGNDTALIGRLKSITNLGAIFDQVIHGRGPSIFTSLREFNL